jgi:hypothetical protein
MSRLPIWRILVRCEGPYRGLWGVVVAFGIVGGALTTIPIHEVSKGGVGVDRVSRDWFVSRVAALVTFRISDKKANLS